MNEERALTWSGKWHIVDPVRSERMSSGSESLIARCGTYVYRNDGARTPTHLQRIKDGTKKSTGLCKVCSRSVGVKTVTVELPDATFFQSATDDENGYQEWSYPHGSVAVSDDGTVMWGQWHITDPQKVYEAGAALIAAAERAKAAIA